MSVRVSHQLLWWRLLLRMKRLHVWVMVVVVHRLWLWQLLHRGVRRWRRGEVSVGEHVDHFVCFVLGEKKFEEEVGDRRFAVCARKFDCGVFLFFLAGFHTLESDFRCSFFFFFR